MRSMLQRGTAAVVEAATLASVLTFASVLGVSSLARAGTSWITGTAFTDGDGDGVQDEADAPLVDQQLYLFDGNGTYAGTTVTDERGHYHFGSLRDGAYRVAYATADWRELREEWVPTTTGRLQPHQDLQLTGSAIADFGWRLISRSANPAAPMSTVVGPTGLTVKSYNDAVTAAEVHDLVSAGTVGVEAATVVIHVDLGATTSTSVSVQSEGGIYSGYRAYVYVSWLSWLDGAAYALSHEYGHAWSLYHAYLTHGDPNLTTYLAARGLADDPRVDSSYLWHRRELIAEDYRQLLGPAAGADPPQATGDLPPASAVPGLEDFLRGAFIGATDRAAPTATPLPMATPLPTAPPAPTASPTSTPMPTATGTSVPTPTPAPTPAETATPPPESVGVQVHGLAVSPTPVTKRAEVVFALTVGADTAVLIYDGRGILVRSLADGPRSAGPSWVAWDRRDDRGRRVKAGTYIAVVEAVDAAGNGARKEVSFVAG